MLKVGVEGGYVSAAFFTCVKGVHKSPVGLLDSQSMFNSPICGHFKSTGNYLISRKVAIVWMHSWCRGRKAHLCEQLDCHYLCMCGWYVPASVDPEQGIVGEGQVELDVGWMMHSHLKPPKESRRNRLALLGSNFDLAPVDSAASHPFLCR